MAVVEKLITPVQVFDPKTGVEIKPNITVQKAYVLLAYLFDEGDEIHTFDVVRGRDNVIDVIFNQYMVQYERCNIFDSSIISETVTPKSAISFYSFIRLCLEKNYLSEHILKMMADLLGVDEVTVEVWNDCVEDDYYDMMQAKEIDSLDSFYKDEWDKQNIVIGED